MKSTIQRLFASCLFALLCATAAFSASKQATVYLYGISTSFNDSTLYVTEIQALNGAWVENGTHFLVGRDNYSYQLRDYLRAQGTPNPTVVTVFALKQKDIEKKMVKLKKKYFAKGTYQIRQLSTAEFQFKPISPLKEDE